MKVIEYLRTHTLDDLREEFAIKVKEYPDCDLVVLNYNQIDSPKYHPIVRECRGLIIDIKNLVPISVTFERFFNLNENENDVFIFDRPFRAEEKADGSLMSVYYYDDSWRIASRGNAFAEGRTASGWSFHEIFECIIGTDINTFMGDLSKVFSYTFEMCSLHNKVIKIYKEATLYLLGAHSFEYGEAGSWNVDLVAKKLDIKRPKVYPIKSVDEIHESFNDFEPTEEGYVLIDVFNNRIKVKNPAYVDLHHMKGNGVITPKRISDVVFRGETEEILSYFPEYRELFEPWQNAYEYLIEAVREHQHLLDDNKLSRKEFALKINSLHFKGLLFSMKNGLTLNESMSKVGAIGKVSLLEYWVKKEK